MSGLERGIPVELTWQAWRSWLSPILKVSHQFTHTAGASLWSSHSEQLDRGPRDSRLASLINNNYLKGASCEEMLASCT